MSDTKEKDYFWQIQGATSFCKAKSDWLPYGRIHLSFVKHDGKNNGCNQLAAIEGTLKLHGTDGALALYQLVVSGGLKALAAKSKASANGNAEPIFKSIGGTTSKRAKDGKCQFRQFSIIPGTKSDYTLVMMTCAGEQNATGGVQPVKGAQRTSVYVPMSSMDMIDMVTSIMVEYSAFRSAQLVRGCEALTTSNANSPETEPPAKVENHAGSEAVSEIPALKTKLVIVYDSYGFINGGKPVVTQLNSGRKLLNSIVAQIAKQNYELQNNESMKQLAFALDNGQNGVWSLLMNRRGGTGQVTIAVIIDDVWEGVTK